jgi:hypothetical protein
MERLLVLDEGLPLRLAGELAARGRRARSLRGPTRDEEVVAALAGDEVLVTTDASLDRAGHALALVVAHGEAAKRETVHRWAHAMATQPKGSLRRYTPRRIL